MRWYKIVFTIITLFIFCIQYSKAQFVSVSCDKMNVLYIGVDNPITVAVSNYDVSKIFVKVDSGIISGGLGEYSWKLNRSNNFGATLSIFVQLKNKDSLLKKIKFRVMNFPIPNLISQYYYDYDSVINNLYSGINFILDNSEVDYFKCKITFLEYDFKINNSSYKHIDLTKSLDKPISKIRNKKINSFSILNAKFKLCDGRVFKIDSYKYYRRKGYSSLRAAYPIK